MKRKPIRKPEYAAINKLIDHYDYGYVWDGHISRPKKEKWLQVLLAGPADKHKIYRKLNNRNLQAHENNEATYYYTPSMTGRGLYNIDIDCHKIGTKEGALAARSYIESLIGCYTEVSTSGLGGHGYVIVEYGDWTAEEVKDIWIALCDALDRKCQHLRLNIEKVEAKGLPGVVVVENRRLMTEKCKMGVLVKLPRDIKAAMTTCTMTPERIVELTQKINDSIPSDGKCESESMLFQPFWKSRKN